MTSFQWGPSCNFFDCIMESVSFLAAIEHNEHMSKEDVVDSMKSRLYFMMGKMLSHGICTSMAMQGWAKERSDDPPVFEERRASVVQFDSKQNINANEMMTQGASKKADVLPTTIKKPKKKSMAVAINSGAQTTSSLMNVSPTKPLKKSIGLSPTKIISMQKEEKKMKETTRDPNATTNMSAIVSKKKKKNMIGDPRAIMNTLKKTPANARLIRKKVMSSEKRKRFLCKFRRFM